MLTGSGCSQFLSESSESSLSSSEEKSTQKKHEGIDLEGKYESFDIETVKEHAEQLEEAAEQSGNSAKVKELIDVLLTDMDTISQALTYLTLEYYADWYDMRLEKQYDMCYEDYYVAYELISYAFANGYENEEYSELLEPYVDMEYLEYYTDRAMSATRLEGYARTDYESMDEYLDEYYEVAYDQEFDEDEKNLKCAEIYLDVLSTYDAETFYDEYNRDFTAEEILELSGCIKELYTDTSLVLEDSFNSTDNSDKLYEEQIGEENPFETVAEYAGLLSPEIKEAADKLLEEELYMITDGRDCYEGSFTIDLPVDNSAVIYLYEYGDCYDLITAIHEFGHFYSSFYDEIPTFLMKNNVDVAEIQSQGMETLYMTLFDDICGEYAQAMEMFKLYDLLNSVIAGFMIGEFEYTVLKNIDTMTPEDVAELFEELAQAYNYDMELYYVSHIFEYPGYYISYGVSALAALEIWQTSLTDTEKAIELYENIARVESNSEDTRFRQSLAECGFSDVLSKDYVISLAQDIEEYAAG